MEQKQIKYMNECIADFISSNNNLLVIKHSDGISLGADYYKNNILLDDRFVYYHKYEYTNMLEPYEPFADMMRLLLNVDK